MSTSGPDASASTVKTLLYLAWPVILARSSQSVIGVCDAAMTAPLGEEALAATTTGAVNTFTIIILPMGIVFIVQSFAAQLQGKSDLAGARRYAYYGIIIAALIGLLSAGLSPFIGAALGIFPYEPGVHALMTDYMVIRLFAIGPIIAIEALGNWYSGLGNTRVHMIVSLLAMALNVLLNWVLIYGNLGAPAMGVEGAALASALASWAAFAMIALAFFRGWGVEAITGPLRLARAEFFRMLRFGVPSGINWFLEFAAFTLFINVVVAELGTVSHAAMMAVINLNSVSFMPAFGLASAGAILAGQAIGRDRRDEVPGVVRTTLSVMLLWQGAVGLSYLIAPTAYMSLFDAPSGNAAELREVGATLLMVSAAWQLFDAVGMGLSETLRSAGDTTWPMWARMALAWLLFTPGAYLAVNVLGGGPVTAMLCLVLYLAALAVALAWRFYVSGAWRDIDLTGDDLPVH